MHAPLKSRMLLGILCLLAPSQLGATPMDLSVSGHVDLGLVSDYLEDNQITYRIDTQGTQIEWVTPPQLLTAGVRSWAQDGEWHNWGEVAIWDSPQLHFAGVVSVSQTIRGVVSSYFSFDAINEAVESLQSLGPTDQTLTVTPIHIPTPAGEVTLGVAVPLQFSVVIPGSTRIIMNQVPVALNDLSNDGDLIGNGVNTSLRGHLRNGGNIVNFGGGIQGDFTNTGHFALLDLSIDGAFQNTGTLVVTTSLNRAAATTNDGPIILDGGRLQLPGGLTDNGGISGCGRLPLSIEEHVGITSNVSGKTLSFEGTAQGASFITGNSPITGISGGSLSMTGVNISGGPITISGGGGLTTSGATIENSAISVSGGPVNLSVSQLKSCVLRGGETSPFAVNGDFDKVINHAPLALNGILQITGGSFENTNTMLNGVGSRLAFTQSTHLVGEGGIHLDGGRFSAGLGTVVTMDSKQSLHGWGLIESNLVYAGTITAGSSDRTLQLNNLTLDSGPALKAENGGSLLLTGVTLNGGSVSRSGSGIVNLVDVIFYSSTLEGSAISIRGSFNQVINHAPLILNGELQINGGSFENTNIIEVGFGSTLSFSQSTLISGSGGIFLDRGRILAGPADTITLGSGQTLRGSGTVTAHLKIAGAFSPSSNSLFNTSQSVTLDPGSTFSFAPPQFGTTLGSGGLSTGTLIVDAASGAGAKLRIILDTSLVDPFEGSDQTFTIAEASGGITGITTTPGSENYALSITGSHVPSSGTWSLQVSSTRLQVIYKASSNSFSSWISGFDLSGSNATPDADYDHDGLSNGIEFVLGGDPTRGDDMVNQPSVEKVSGGIEFTFRRSRGALESNPRVVHSSRLDGAWTTAEDSFDGVSMHIDPISYGPDIDKVTVFIPTADPAHFVRLKAGFPPVGGE